MIEATAVPSSARRPSGWTRASRSGANRSARPPRYPATASQNFEPELRFGARRSSRQVDVDAGGQQGGQRDERTKDGAPLGTSVIGHELSSLLAVGLSLGLRAGVGRSSPGPQPG